MNSVGPDMWAETSIGKLLGQKALYCDGDWVESKDQDEQGSNRLIQLADIGDGRFLDKSNRFMNDEQFKRLRCTELKVGDILIARMPEPIGRACIFPAQNKRCATVVDVAIIRDPNADSYWLMSMLNSSEFRRKIENQSTGTTRTRISRGFLSEITFNAPTLILQREIATILKSIDQTIEKTEALIQKYQQIKQGLMHDLFTRGVTPDGKLRPAREQVPELYKETSIGWIPSEWGQSELDHKIRIIDCKHYTPKYVEDGYPIIRPRNVNEDGLDFEDVDYISKSDYILLTDIHEPSTGDIVYSRNASFGIPCYVENNTKFAIGQDVVIMTKIEMNTKYIYYVLKSDLIWRQISRLFAGSTFSRINLGDIRQFIIPVPSEKEQRKTVTHLEAVDKKINREIKQLKKLFKQKSGLMRDLLTGKVRVRTD